MIRLLLGAAIFAMCTATAAAQMSSDVLKSLRTVVEGPSVPKIIAVLHQLVEIDDECDAATKLVVVYQGETAHVFLVVDGKACAVVTGPADGIRRLMLKAARGVPV